MRARQCNCRQHESMNAVDMYDSRTGDGPGDAVVLGDADCVTVHMRVRVPSRGECALASARTSARLQAREQVRACKCVNKCANHHAHHHAQQHHGASRLARTPQKSSRNTGTWPVVLLMVSKGIIRNTGTLCWAAGTPGGAPPRRCRAPRPTTGSCCAEPSKKAGGFEVARRSWRSHARATSGPGRTCAGRCAFNGVASMPGTVSAPATTRHTHSMTPGAPIDSFRHINPMSRDQFFLKLGFF
jgi:hypothetical protein